jgi:N-carbamoyl-L-amino-acid hydrolase
MRNSTIAPRGSTTAGSAADAATTHTPRNTSAVRLKIDGGRLLDRIERFAAIGRGENGGIDRAGFSEADREARTCLAQEARRAGLETVIDAGGNLLIRRPGRADGQGGRRADRPQVLVGSHLDTVLNGGKLDGAYGVLAGLEVLETLHAAVAETSCDITVVAFANEEGALFPQPFWGSMVLAGRLDDLPDEPRDYAGRPLRDALTLAGGDLSDLESAVWPPGALAAYLELHVEQGPVLEQLGKPIGVVDSITGRTQLAVEIQGAAGHAGTTPMKGRRDALAAAACAITAVQQLARQEELCRVATVGWLEVLPNSSNTIPDTVRFAVDLRDSSLRRLAAAEQTLRGALSSVAHRSQVRITVEGAIRTDPVQTDTQLREAIATAARELGFAYETLPSGAGHDAQVMAGIAPIGMIFVPSIGGVSHVPWENTAPEDLIAGANVLLHTLLRM